MYKIYLIHLRNSVLIINLNNQENIDKTISLLKLFS